MGPRLSRTRGALVVGVLVASAFGVAACGEESADVENGKKQFAACGGCHTLADAGTSATVGPNLDDAFRAARRQGFEPSSFEGVVEQWIRQPEQKTEPKMPPGVVKGKDARDVAAYVAKVAGTDQESPARPAEETE